MTNFQEIRKLYDIYDDSFGISEAEIITCENRIGKRLPKVLRDYYLQFGNNNQINQTQDCLMLPAKIQIKKDKYLSFYQENQGNWEATIALSDFNLDNPPVYYDFDEVEKIESVLSFLYGMALLQTIFAFPFNAHALDIGQETEIFVKANWGLITNFKTPSFKLEFFQNSTLEVITLMDESSQSLTLEVINLTEISGKHIVIASKDRRNFKEIEEKFDLIWEWNTLENE